MFLLTHASLAPPFSQDDVALWASTPPLLIPLPLPWINCKHPRSLPLPLHLQSCSPPSLGDAHASHVFQGPSNPATHLPLSEVARPKGGI